MSRSKASAMAIGNHLKELRGSGSRACCRSGWARRCAIRLSVVLAAAILPLSISARANADALPEDTLVSWLQAQFGYTTGYVTCPVDQLSSDPYGWHCLAEFHVGHTYHLTKATVDDIDDYVIASHDRHWLRRWSTYSHSRIAGFNARHGGRQQPRVRLGLCCCRHLLTRLSAAP